jgi:hypothetical protein
MTQNDEKTKKLIERRSQVVTELHRLSTKQAALFTFLRVADRKIENSRAASKGDNGN